MAVVKDNVMSTTPTLQTIIGSVTIYDPSLTDILIATSASASFTQGGTSIQSIATTDLAVTTQALPTSSPVRPTTRSHGLSAGVKAGIGISVVVAAAFFALLIIWILRRRRRTKRQAPDITHEQVLDDKPELEGSRPTGLCLADGRKPELPGNPPGHGTLSESESPTLSSKSPNVVSTRTVKLKAGSSHERSPKRDSEAEDYPSTRQPPEEEDYPSVQQPQELSSVTQNQLFPVVEDDSVMEQNLPPTITGVVGRVETDEELTQLKKQVEQISDVIDANETLQRLRDEKAALIEKIRLAEERAAGYHGRPG